VTSKEQHRQQWAERIANFRASGLTMAAWSAENQVSVDQLKYWLYKVKKSSPTDPSSSSSGWVPFAVTSTSSDSSGASLLVVRVGPAAIELRPGFDPVLLREVVEALQISC
jgi:hypothetical protein